MTSTTTTTSALDAPTVSPLRLYRAHVRAILVETMRVPIAVIGAMAFPAMSLLFFVVPNRAVADDPVFATQAVISLSVFAVLASSLFNLGLSIAESREKPWDPYLRSLPLSSTVRIGAQLTATSVISLAAIIPVVLLGALTTAAEVSALGFVLGFAVLAVTSIPFLLIAVCIGYAFASKAAIAIIQVVMFGFAFAGGLFLPPQLFPEWLDAISRFIAARHARDLVISAAEVTAPELWVLIGVLAWTVIVGALAVWLYRRDEGRRYR
jgi:ABC-2 type transport system permease protein